MTTSADVRSPGRRSRLTLVATVALAGALGACARGDTTGSLNYPRDVRERHPIVLRDSVRTLDVFVPRAGVGLDARQSDDVAAFGADYARAGRGALVAEVPSGAGREFSASSGLDAVRRSLARAGISPGTLRVSTYRADDPTMAAPIRLSFARLKAEVPHECGQWPDDLGITNNIKSQVENRNYWNFGCAYQANLAAQVADPVDLVRARQEGRIDTVKRMGAIDKIRQGKDPSTEYRQEATKLNQSVGSN